MERVTRKMANDSCRGADQAAASFSAKNKRFLERYVCEQFLQGLGLQFDPGELLQVKNEDDPIDVVFRDVSFQVKEVLDAGRRRHDDLRNERKRLEALRQDVQAGKAIGREHLGRWVEPIEISLTEIADRAYSEATKLAEEKYEASVRSGMDLLFSFNLLRHWLSPGDLPHTGRFAALGYRSVCAVFTHTSLVLHAGKGAARFLRNRQGRSVTRKFRS